LIQAPGAALNVHEMDAERVTRSIAWLTQRYRDAA
jgi:hypothetical protein